MLPSLPVVSAAHFFLTEKPDLRDEILYVRHEALHDRPSSDCIDWCVAHQTAFTRAAHQFSDEAQHASPEAQRRAHYSVAQFAHASQELAAYVPYLQSGWPSDPHPANRFHRASRIIVLCVELLRQGNDAPEIFTPWVIGDEVETLWQLAMAESAALEGTVDEIPAFSVAALTAIADNIGRVDGRLANPEIFGLEARLAKARSKSNVT